MSGIIEVFGHGGDVETAASRFGGSPEDFLDFSANINPLGPPKDVLKALEQGMRAILRYPDPAHRTFKSLLGERLGLSEEYISIGNGAAESMALILLGLSPGRWALWNRGSRSIVPCPSNLGLKCIMFWERRSLNGEQLLKISRG